MSAAATIGGFVGGALTAGSLVWLHLDAKIDRLRNDGELPPTVADLKAKIAVLEDDAQAIDEMRVEQAQRADRAEFALLAERAGARCLTPNVVDLEARRREAMRLHPAGTTRGRRS